MKPKKITFLTIFIHLVAIILFFINYPVFGETFKNGEIKNSKKIILQEKNENNISLDHIGCFFAFSNKPQCMVKRLSNDEICEVIDGWNNNRGITEDIYRNSLKEKSFRNLKCDINREITVKNKTITLQEYRDIILSEKEKDSSKIVDFLAKHIKPTTDYSSSPDPSVNYSNKTSNEKDLIDLNLHILKELKKEKEKSNLLEKKLSLLVSKEKEVKSNIATDNQKPTIKILKKNLKNMQGFIKGRVQDNVGIADIIIEGNSVSFNENGDFFYKSYIPLNGKNIKIKTFDLAGLSNSISVPFKRETKPKSNVIFDNLNPLGKKVKENSNALALIIGVDKYANTNARALYADNDAQLFADYASQKLGVPINRIKILLNENAGQSELLLSLKRWLARSVRQNKSDVYIFFAGHGLASDNGEKMYLLPYDGTPQLLEDTAILRDRLFNDISKSNPRSVTIFLDTCYSGTTRTPEILVASRPIAIIAKQQPIPKDFTIFTAAASDQTAKPLEEVKHGLFSYFLMKGMEGDADANYDNKITTWELHNFIKKNVLQQSIGTQTPELQGSKERVLVRFN